jgi:hypothetical protein
VALGGVVRWIGGHLDITEAALEDQILVPRGSLGSVQTRYSICRSTRMAVGVFEVDGGVVAVGHHRAAPVMVVKADAEGLGDLGVAADVAG